MEGADYINLISKRNDLTIISIRGSKLYDQEIKGFLGFIRKKILIPFIYNRADIIITVSKKLQDELKHLGIKKPKIIHIPNGYDIPQIIKKSNFDIPEEFKGLKTIRYLVNVGRLHVQKNQINLINVFSQLKKLDKKLKLVIVGNGEKYDSLLSLCAIHNLNAYPKHKEIKSADVIFTGNQLNPFPFIKNSIAFVLSSEWEGFPNALAEALIIGKPVVSADCPTGPREIIAPESSGILLSKKAEKTKYGLLLPILGNKPSKDMINLWSWEINNYLEKIDISQETINKDRMKEYELSAVMNKWDHIITIDQQ